MLGHAMAIPPDLEKMLGDRERAIAHHKEATTSLGNTDYGRNCQVISIGKYNDKNPNFFVFDWVQRKIVG